MNRADLADQYAEHLNARIAHYQRIWKASVHSARMVVLDAFERKWIRQYDLTVQEEIEAAKKSLSGPLDGVTTP